MQAWFLGPSLVFPHRPGPLHPCRRCDGLQTLPPPLLAAWAARGPHPGMRATRYLATVEHHDLTGKDR